MAVGFAPLTGTYNPSNPPAPVIVAGVPGNKSQAGTGLDGFTVAKYAPAGGAGGRNHDLVTSFGKTLTSGMGNLAFDPSAAHPGFEFTITNFSKLLGANPLERSGRSALKTARSRASSPARITSGRHAHRGAGNPGTDDLDGLGGPGRWIGLEPPPLAASSPLTFDSFELVSDINASLRKTAAVPYQTAVLYIGLERRRSPAVFLQASRASPPVPNSRLSPRQCFDPHPRFATTVATQAPIKIARSDATLPKVAIP